MAESRGLALTSAGKDDPVGEAVAVLPAAAAPTLVTTGARAGWIGRSMVPGAPRRPTDAPWAPAAQASP